MKGSMSLQPNKPRHNIRVLDLKKIDCSHTRLSSKQVLRTLPVLLKNVGRSPVYLGESFTACTTRALSPFMHLEHADKEGKAGPKVTNNRTINSTRRSAPPGPTHFTGPTNVEGNCF